MSKKYYWNLLTISVLAMLSVTFSACSSDDEVRYSNVKKQEVIFRAIPFGCFDIPLPKN